VLVEVESKPIGVPVLAKTFPDTTLVVEEAYANPPPDARKAIDEDNRAIAKAYGQADGAPQFERAFRRPPGVVTSPFGEWRTYADGHREQHVGTDLVACPAASSIRSRS
jgi:murein DD-endopeptidase MepM/ murein hydrolase activator NlpD